MIEAGVVLSGRYRLVRPIGEGGMGAVWEAEHTAVGRKVAIKVLHADFMKRPEIVERFEREARSAAAIGNDHIIDVLDFGTHDGQPYMAMEYLAGQSLASRLEKEPRLTLGETVAVMNQVLSALAAAHGVGIVHRDLKPENVFLVQKGNGRELVKLLDFGISKIGGEDKGNKGLTQTGALMGTPMYMAPEQALAKKDIDARADVYSAGVMLYEMVTGQLPFSAESQTELLMLIVYQPNAARPPREINPALPPEFEAVVMRAMAREREQRYPTAQALAEALAPWSQPGAPGFELVAPAPKPSAPDPSVVLGREATLAGTSVAVAPKKRRTPLVLAVLGSAALVVGVVAVAARGHAPAAPVAPPRVAAVVPSSPIVAAAPSPVAIDVDGVPTTGQLEVDGHPASSPHLEFVRGTIHELRVTAPGMVPFATSVTADRDRSIVVALAPSAAPAEPPPAATAPTEHAHHGGAHAATPGAEPPTTAPPHAGHGTLLPVSNEF